MRVPSRPAPFNSALPKRQEELETANARYSTYAVYLISADIGESDCKAAEAGGQDDQEPVRISREARDEFSKIVIVPVHGNKDLGRGLVKKIEKETGVKLI